MQVADPGHVLGVALKNASAFVGALKSGGQRADHGAVRAMKLTITVEDVIDAIVEIARMAIGIDDVDRIESIRGILDVGAVAKGERHIDHDVAGLPGFAKIVREGVGRLEAGVEAAKEVIEPAAAVVFGREKVQIGIGDPRTIAGNIIGLGEPIGEVAWRARQAGIEAVFASMFGIDGQEAAVGAQPKRGSGMIIGSPVDRAIRCGSGDPTRDRRRRRQRRRSATGSRDPLATEPTRSVDP